MTAKVHLICDEAATLGNLPVIEDVLDKSRSYGLRAILAYQDMGQLQECWPRGKSQTLLANCTKIFAGVQDNHTAEYVSAHLGPATDVIGSTTSNDGGSTTVNSGRGCVDDSRGTTRSWGSSTTWSYHKRELLQPAEVMQLPQNVAITFSPGIRPIQTKLVRYFEEPDLQSGPIRSLLSSGLLFARSVAFFFVCLCLALLMVDLSMVPAQRPPTLSVGYEWGNYGKGQVVDWQGGIAPRRTR